MERWENGGALVRAQVQWNVHAWVVQGLAMPAGAHICAGEYTKRKVTLQRMFLSDLMQNVHQIWWSPIRKLRWRPNTYHSVHKYNLLEIISTYLSRISYEKNASKLLLHTKRPTFDDSQKRSRRQAALNISLHQQAHRHEYPTRRSLPSCSGRRP